jgi:hypothetical protein
MGVGRSFGIKRIQQLKSTRRRTTMIKMNRKWRLPSECEFESRDTIITRAYRHLGEWFTGIYSELNADQKVAWLELLVLATRSRGQINYVSDDLLPALLCIDKDVFADVCKKGQEKGKLKVVERAIVPATVSQLRAVPGGCEEIAGRSGFDARLMWTNPCAIYKTMFFPGAFDYFHDRPVVNWPYPKREAVILDDPQGLWTTFADARELMRNRLATAAFEMPFPEPIEKSPFRMCKPEDLPSSISIFDEALGCLDYQILNELDDALCTWDLYYVQEFERLGGGIHSMRWALFHRLDRLAESEPSYMPRELHQEKILRADGAQADSTGDYQLSDLAARK